MSSDLFAIGSSGLRAYQNALGTTSENIANAGVAGYSRRDTTLREIKVTDNNALRLGPRTTGAGVAVTGIARAGDGFRVAEARVAGSDLARTEGGIVWMERVETSLTGNQLSDRLTQFFSAADKVAADPAASTPRAVFLESARSLATAFDGTGKSLDTVAAELAKTGGDAAVRLTDLAANLDKVNIGLAKAQPNSVGQAQLLDERDRLLEGMAALVDIDLQQDGFGRATVKAGGAAGAALVDANGAGLVSFASNAGGVAAFSVRRGLELSEIPAHGGAFAGITDGALRIATARGSLDTLATQFKAGMKTLQESGKTLAGTAGAEIFAVGDSPTELSVTLDDPRLLAVAAMTEGPRGNGNFLDLAEWRKTGGFETALDNITASQAAALAARRDVATAQGAIRDAATTARDSYSAVDLDEEAVNLIRFQQAYQASSRVIQVARDILQTIIDIR